MSTRNWNKERAEARIRAKIEKAPLRVIEIKPYVRDTDLSGLPATVAYRVHGVHLYADILNLQEILNTKDFEGEMLHRRVLRFLNLQYRAVHRILQSEDALLIDFHNQRLHSVVAKPYDDEKKRIHRAIAISQLIVDVLAQTGEDADHPPAKVRIGIDTGSALAVNNGRRGHREPLFLGEPANLAAKRASGGTKAGIFLTNNARKAIGLAALANVDTTPLSADEIAASQKIANLNLGFDKVVRDWKADLAAHPIGKFEFSGHTPPMATLDIETLSAANSRRLDAATVYGDIDGFTKYVGDHIGTDAGAKHVVRTLLVLRSELDAVLHEDFKGRKVRFIGDCIHGLLAEGTAQNTDAEETINTMILCAGGMRSSFDLALALLKQNGTDATALGLQLGFEYGPTPVTRLGMKGELIRCSVSRSVLAAEAEQGRCGGAETAIGETAHKKASAAGKALFDSTRKRKGLSYQVALTALSAHARGSSGSGSLLKAASTASAPYAFANRAAGPAKPDGFA